ncbi:MAG: DUF5119 domain-containing protein [Bacteroidales bacterium]|nr:DUF5119 domain-containing protein [Bacteroidales bacterium]
MKTLMHIKLFIALLALVACERRPLEDLANYTNIQVAVDIEAVANVTCDVYNSKIPVPVIEPQAMHVLFFELNSNQVAAETFISDISQDSNGRRILRGNISIMPGNYKMLIYDFGTEATIVDDYYTWEKCRAYTSEVSSSLKSSFKTKVPLENMVYEPDHLVVASNSNEHIPYVEDVYTIEAAARSVVESYYLQIKVEGLEYVSSARAVLSGMVGANHIALNEKITDPQATIFFSLNKSDDKGVPVVCNVFNTFGRIENSTNEMEVTFDIKTNDGRVIQKTFDISDLFLSEECIKHHWLLINETIVIDPPKNAGGGFNPEVGDWDEEHREIEL